MHLTSFLLSSATKRLVPAVYGITLKGVHVQTQLQLEPTSAAGTDSTVQVGEDASFVCIKPSSRYHVCGKGFLSELSACSSELTFCTLKAWLMVLGVGSKRAWTRPSFPRCSWRAAGGCLRGRLWI